MDILNKKIKIIAIETIARSRYLLSSEDFPEYCLQVVDYGDEDIPKDELLPIDRVTKFNAFRNFTPEELSNGIRQKLINRLSSNSIEKIEKLFEVKDTSLQEHISVEDEDFDQIISKLSSFKKYLDVTSWQRLEVDFGSQNSRGINQFIK